MIISNFLSIFLIGMPGGSEWIFIILAIVLLFGGRKIPELMKGLGKGIKEFKEDEELKELRRQLDQKQA